MPPQFWRKCPPPSRVRIPHMVKIFSVMEKNFQVSAKKLQVEGSNPPLGPKFSRPGAKFHGWGMGCGGVWGVMVRDLHFSHFRDEESAFFAVRGQGFALNFHNFVRGSPLNFEIFGFYRRRFSAAGGPASRAAPWEAGGRPPKSGAGKTRKFQNLGGNP